MNVLEMQTFACVALEWFQQAVMRLCVCAAVVLLAMPILRTQIVRDAVARLASLWREASHWTRFVVIAFVAGFVIYAGTKTNFPPAGVMMPLLPPLPQAVVQQITEQEIAQGWRLESVTTNDAVSYAIPTNGVEYMPSTVGTTNDWDLAIGAFKDSNGTSRWEYASACTNLLNSYTASDCIEVYSR